MSKSYQVRVIFLSLLILNACASLPPAAGPRSDTIVAASSGRTWDAVVDFFARASIPIKTIDRSSGIIAAETTQLAGDNSSYGVCTNGFRQFEPQGASFNVLVRGDSTRSTLRVTASWLAIRYGTDIRCVTSDVWEKRFETAIKAKAEER